MGRLAARSGKLSAAFATKTDKGGQPVAAAPRVGPGACESAIPAALHDTRTESLPSHAPHSRGPCPAPPRPTPSHPPPRTHPAAIHPLCPFRPYPLPYPLPLPPSPHSHPTLRHPHTTLTPPLHHSHTTSHHLSPHPSPHPLTTLTPTSSRRTQPHLAPPTFGTPSPAPCPHSKVPTRTQLPPLNLSNPRLPRPPSPVGCRRSRRIQPQSPRRVTPFEWFRLSDAPPLPFWRGGPLRQYPRGRCSTHQATNQPALLGAARTTNHTDAQAISAGGGVSTGTSTLAAPMTCDESRVTSVVKGLCPLTAYVYIYHD